MVPYPEMVPPLLVAIEIAVRAFDQPARRILAVCVRHRAVPVNKGVQKCKLALECELEHRAVAWVNGTPTSIIAAVDSCAVEIAVGGLQQRRLGQVAVRVVPGAGEAEQLGDR